jgi:hypothetical protein
VTTDGAPSVTGKSSGFVTKPLANQNEVFPDRKFDHVSASFTRKCFVQKP